MFPKKYIFVHSAEMFQEGFNSFPWDTSFLNIQKLKTEVILQFVLSASAW
jgi:hypothetical protein